ncbi:hypothetical protein GIY56_04130 [Paracoccus sp. YIM 132242]|uniref:Uncharacterized protein n=1 Tax=Paracoccus lichenicola TaxID=2665644 RepID=A0A6L6HJY9_9RHOB|nr:hypothetical protein [Paracoccus lichenicola]MTD99473.1 hypothetical protein [Paracoccus lichenicola]
MKRSLALCLLTAGAVVLASCEESGSSDNNDNPFDERELERCGLTTDDPFVGHAISSANDEGAGFVSFNETSFIDTEGSVGVLHVIQCSSGEAVRMTRNPNFSFEDAHPHDATLRDLVPQGVKPLSLARLEEYGRTNGLRTSRGQATSQSKTASCACELYYPGSTANWSKAAAAE